MFNFLKWKSITLNIPDSLDIDDKELSMMFASKLYEQGKLSLSQVSRALQDLQ